MKPIKFTEQNCTYAENQPEYLPLPAFKDEQPAGQVVSCWKLSFRERIRIYEYWLDLLNAKGIKIKFSRKGAVVSTIISSIAAIVTRNPLPLTGISPHFLRYLLDEVGGMRGLQNFAENRKKFSEELAEYLVKANSTFNQSLLRFPEKDTFK